MFVELVSEFVPLLWRLLFVEAGVERSDLRLLEATRFPCVESNSVRGAPKKSDVRVADPIERLLLGPLRKSSGALLMRLL